jgi:hypothetical protein
VPESAVSVLTGLPMSRRITRRIQDILPRSRIHEVSQMAAAMAVFRDTVIERRHDVEQKDVETRAQEAKCTARARNVLIPASSADSLRFIVHESDTNRMRISFMHDAATAANFQVLIERLAARMAA